MEFIDHFIDFPINCASLNKYVHWKPPIRGFAVHQRVQESLFWHKVDFHEPRSIISDMNTYSDFCG